MQHISPLDALREAVATCRTQQAFAERIGVRQGTVSKWLNGTHPVPAEMVIPIEDATGVSRHDLRPDIYPRERLVDRLVGTRFTGVDRFAGSPDQRQIARTA